MAGMGPADRRRARHVRSLRPAHRAGCDRRGETGGFDVVINNAAIYPSKPFEDYTIEEHQAVQRVNVDAGIVCVQALCRACGRRGFGRIINIASVTLSGGWANLSPYVQSKGALVGLTRAWAREFGPYGVTVNAISPGAFPTDAEKIHPDPEGYNALRSRSPGGQAPRRAGRYRQCTDVLLLRRGRLHHRPDAQCRWRLVDELRPFVHVRL